MDIYIEPNYRITANENEYTLHSNRLVRKKDSNEGKKGEVYYKRQRHFARLEHLIRALMRDRVKESDASTLKELLEVLKESREWVQKELQGV